MDAIFSRMASDYHLRYNVTVHSTSPWIVTFDNFVTDIEIDALISTVSGNWERSTDTGAVNEFGEAGRVISQVIKSSSTSFLAITHEHARTH